MQVCTCGHNTSVHSFKEVRECRRRGCDCEAYQKDESFPSSARAWFYLTGREREIVCDTARSLGGHAQVAVVDGYYTIVTSTEKLTKEQATAVLRAKAEDTTHSF